ncbi:MAG: peptidoglycan-binding domain-containing protein [Gammaproteobacteria bacterium]
MYKKVSKQVNYVIQTDSDRLVYHAQMRLSHKGYKPGPADGLMGRKTRKAIANFQWDTGLPITGELDRKTLKALGLTVSSYAQVGAARLKVLDVPAQEYTQEELVNRLKQLRVRFDGGRHLMLFDVDGFTVHTGHINQLIKDECIRPYDISIGEMHVQGQSLKSEDFGDIFAGALAGEMYKLHNGRKNNAIRNTTKAAVLVCTAAMF